MKSETVGILFILYGVLLTILAAAVAKDINNDELSDKFVGCQQTILSLGSMCLAFGLVIYLISRNGAMYNVASLPKIYLAFGAMVTLSLLVCSSIMHVELKQLNLLNENIGRATITSIVLGVLVLLFHMAVVGKYFYNENKGIRLKKLSKLDTVLNNNMMF